MNAPGTLPARYEIVRQLGRGGQGVTYLVHDRERDEEVVAKVHSFKTVEGWKAVELFEREARILESLDHPRIPKYRDHFVVEDEDDVRLVLVQDYVRGHDLAGEIGTPCEEEAIVALARAVAETLAYLHALAPPVVHRDVKPSNLIRGEDGHIYVVDFGAAQVVAPVTVGGSTIIGTTGYAPAEQFMGKAAPASDVYSLGATLLHLASGRHPADLPFERGRPRHEDVVASPRLSAIIAHLCAPHAEDRPANGSELLRYLDTVAGPAATETETTSIGPGVLVKSLVKPPERAPSKAMVRWRESYGENGVTLRDPDREWLRLTRSSGKLQRALGVALLLPPVMLVEKPRKLEMRVDRWNGARLLLMAVFAAPCVLAIATQSAAPILFATMSFAALGVLFNHRGGYDWYGFADGEYTFHKSFKPVDRAALADIESVEADGQAVVLRFSGGKRERVEIPGLPRAALEYAALVLSRDLETLRQGGAIDVQDVY